MNPTIAVSPALGRSAPTKRLVRKGELAHHLAGSLVIPRMSVRGFPVLGRLEDWRELDEEGALVWAPQSVGLMPEREGRHRSLGIQHHRWAAVRHPLSMVAAKAEIAIGSEVTKDAPPRTAEMGNPACPIRSFKRPPDGGRRACVAAASHGGA